MAIVTMECEWETVSSFRMVPFSMTSNNPWPRLQGHAITWRWISQKLYEIQTVTMKTLTDLHTPYSMMSFRS